MIGTLPLSSTSTPAAGDGDASSTITAHFEVLFLADDLVARWLRGAATFVALTMRGLSIAATFATGAVAFVPDFDLVRHDDVPDVYDLYRILRCHRRQSFS